MPTHKKRDLEALLVGLVLSTSLVACNWLQGAKPPPTQVESATQAAPAGQPGADNSPESQTLESLKKVDEHPLYTMRYYGAYPQANTAALAQAGTPDTPGPSLPWACSLFAALGDEEAMLYGRNFDWDHSPALLLFADPPDGYASVSMVDIAYLGFEPAQLFKLDELSPSELQPLLYAPGLPFDGMNEHGLAIGMAAVPASAQPYDADKETIGSLGIIRQMLDHARTTDEAVAIMQRYNIDFTGGPPVHYLIADAAGQAVLVEFYQGEMVVIPNEAAWHQATNFLRAAVTSTKGQCGRYDKIASRLSQAEGRLSGSDALGLLAGVAQPNTQWSIVYEMRAGDISVAMGCKYDNAHTFHLKLAKE
ncbi:MAG: linear amide C-N hydrolase [Thermoflexales bacterium]|nr:linear amide C-N hydrolase [Thermoflexales bacterium]